MQAALSLLARREHSRYELGQKLKQRFTIAEVEAVLERCAQQNLLCDKRFLESRLRHRLQQAYGPLWIRQDLREHRLDEDQVAEVLNLGEEFWVDQALRVLDKKFGRLNLSQQHPKIQRYLYQKGYPLSVIQQAFKQASLNND
jgi:regulatory protein